MVVTVLLTVAGLHVPVIPLVDTVGNEGTVALAHTVNDVPILNVGMMFGVIVTVNVVGVAHKPAVGVKVYTPDAALLTTAGFHVPVMPLSDVVGNVGTVPLTQKVTDVPKPNTGTTLGLTVTVNVVGNAHTPAVGVKVYVPEDWLLTVAGLHVPVIPLLDVAGNEGTAAF